MSQYTSDTELDAHRRGWRAFLMSVKWFALHALALIFFLIFWLIGHGPFVPTLVLVAAATFIIGRTFR